MRKFIKTTIHEYLNESRKGLLAPNGNKSNLPKHLYDYVRTEEFKKWFGDWENDPDNSSKIIDENGEPLLVFHGSKVKFVKFDDSKQKIGWLGKGVYFTKDKHATKEYGRYVIKAFLNIRNPFIVIGETPNDVYYEVIGKVDESDVSIILKQKGYDGLIFNHWDKGNMINCFSTSQIKTTTNEYLKESNHNISNVIIDIGQKYSNEHNKTIKQLNSGYCEDIAYDIIDVIGGETSNTYIIDDGWFWSTNKISKYKTKCNEYWNVENLRKYGEPPFGYDNLNKLDLKGHVWVFSNNKHYDVEATHGVDNFWELPIYQRQLTELNLI